MKLNKAIQNRWSPRAFSDKPVTEEQLKLLLEAARRAPSSRNAQPWNYYYVRRKNQSVFNDFIGILTGKNPGWAHQAQILMISVMKKLHNYKRRPNGKALHDIGAANVSIAIQAADMGLQIHQMGGFDKVQATEYLKLDTELYEPVTMIAVGYPPKETPTSNEQKARMKQHLSRKEINEFVHQL